MLVSVVICALNEAARIAACVRSVAEQAGPPAEIIVVDGGSADRTPELAPPPARVLTAPRGRAAQLNAGAAASRGDVLLFLHADSLLPAGGLSAMRAALADPTLAGGTFRLRFDHPAPLLSFLAWCTRFRFTLFHYGDQGIFVRRPVFERLSGFCDQPLLEDLEFLLRLRREGGVGLLETAVTTSARRFLQNGIVRQQALNMALVVLYLLGLNPGRLARWYGVEDRRG